MDIEDDSEICKDFALRELRRFGQVVRRHCSDFEKTVQRQPINSSCQVNSFRQKPRDGVNPVLLVKTGSPAFDKIVLSLSSICLEVDDLVEQTYFVKQIHDYGDSGGAPELQLSKFVPTLRKLQAYVSRCANAVQLAVSQIVGLYSFAPQNDGVTSQVVFLSLARLFVSLTTLDTVICQQAVLKEHVQIYLRLLKSWKYDAKLSEQVKALLKLMIDINAELLGGTILKDCIRKAQMCGPKSSDALKETIRLHLTELDAKVNECQAQIFLRSEKFVGVCGLFLLHFNIKQQADRQLFRLIVDLSKKIGAVSLTGNAVWDAQSFFMREIPALGSLFPTQNRPSSYLVQMLPRLPQEVTGYENQAALWLLRIDSSFGDSEDDYKAETLKTKCRLLLQGNNIARCLNQHLNLIISLHVSAKKAMSKSTLISAAKMICALNALRVGLSRYQSRVDEAIAHVDQHLHHQLLETVVKIKQKMSTEKKNDKRKLDANAAIKLAEASLRGPFTKLKEICINLAKEYIAQVKIIRPDEAKTLNSNLKRLSVIANFADIFRKSVDVWGLSSHHVVLLEVFLSQMYNNNSSVTSSTAPSMIETITAEEKVQASVEKIVRGSLTGPLCRDIENDLRIQMHTHLVADPRNPFTQNKPQIQTQLKRICQTELLLPTEKVSVKRGVERYLERIFYNLTTVALHDWGTYDEMRVIAELKFDARTVESHLPAETLDQGLDVLNVMRNIEGFSSKFVYNMNNQTFVERVSSNKHLNTVNISHIANSIRTHGPGITNTTVNVVYRFLKNQFEILSQLLFNEHIKSRLMRDIAFFRENKESLQQKYPFARAEKICKSVRNLGVTPEGFTYLDKFRQLMTSVGNAMGYVRMMRTGALEYCAQGNAILPDSTDDSYESFLESIKETSFRDHNEVSDGAQHLDSVIGSLLKQQSGVEGADYFKRLTDAFEGPFCDEKNAYLQNFYILVPSLTLNFVEHIVQSRERLSRRSKNDAVFSDDGFVIGVAFALRLTKQFTNFDSLHWFNSVDEKYVEEMKMSQEASRNSFSDEKLSQTISLTAKRIEAYRREFNLLNHAFTSARIFFKVTS